MHHHIPARALALLLAASSIIALQAQFTAYNDHYSGPGTHPNATAWNVFGTTGGAPGSAGPLKDVTSGATLPVTISITSSGITGGTAAGAPNAGTPAYAIFNGFIDWGNATVNNAIQTPAGASVTRVLSGLDPNKRYSYSATAIRGNGYADRWIRIALTGAQSFTSAHTSGCLTNGSAGTSIAVNECVINSGDNLVGATAIWQEIQPAADGTITITCTQYQGAVPGGSSGGSYGYSIAAEKLEEFNVVASPAVITNHPSSQSVAELGSATFTVGVSGNPRPAIQWFKDGSAINGATNSTYVHTPVLLADNTSTFYAAASNYVGNTPYLVTSVAATLSVTADLTAPTLLSAISSGGSLVQVILSEPVTEATATNLSNYAVTKNVQVTNALLAVDGTNLTLFTTPQTFGDTYALTVNRLRDRSAAGNVIGTNSTIMFTAVDFTASNIGAPQLPGNITVISGTGFNVSGSGSDIGGTADQFTFANQQRAGDFDLMVRVAALDIADAWSRATLMARESLATNSVFAAAVATPNLAGCFYQTRTATGGNSTQAGSFPSSMPYTWLRLKRLGTTFTGYAGVDGQNWVQLGSSTLAVGNVYVGFGVSSRASNQLVTAQFRDYMPVGTNAQVVSSVRFTTEPLAASTRRTGMVISEIMYRPAPSTNTNSLEFVEIFNSNPMFEDIGGWRISGDIDYTFPPNTFIPGGGIFVIAKNPAYLQSVYGISSVFGPYSNSLPREGTIRLRTEFDAIVLEVPYSNENPWPVGADNTGHSLVLDRASYGEKFPQAWGVSDRVGGSPGRPEPLKTSTGLRSVVINEFLAHTDFPTLDFIELYNHSNAEIDISGCYLSDSATTNKFKIAPNTTIPARGFISFTENQLGFALGSDGETIYFRDSTATQMIDAVQFGAQENGVAMGRAPDGAGEFYRLAAATPGTNNAAIRVHDIVINEIMFAPISEEPDDQFIELYNNGTNAVNIGAWRLRSGIDFRFPSNTVIAAGDYVVVARDVTNILALYSYLNPAKLFGPFDGQLAKNGERLTLTMPDSIIGTNNNGQVSTNTIDIVVDEVTYRSGGRWPKWAREGGSSMELIDARANHRLAYNWADSEESAKAPWTHVEFIGRMDNGAATLSAPPIDRIEIQTLGETEFLLDNIEVRVMTGTNAGPNLLSNGDFEAGLGIATPQGNHIRSILSTNEGFASSRSLRVRASGNGDSGANRVRIALGAPLLDQQYVMIRAKARWIRGWPEFIIRTEGNFLEAYGRMTLPTNLGTPGLPNSRRVNNAPPAIHEVVHNPILPAANENVVVTARIDDPNPLASVILFYRLDASSTFNNIGMNDLGAAGDAIARDGIYSGTIPGQAAGQMVAFYIQATDSLGAGSQFPAQPVPQRECLVRFGDPTPAGGFATYRMWISTLNVNAWVGRPSLSNEDIDNTFVVGNYRVIYNAGAHYSGSPYHQGFGHPVTSGCHYRLQLPQDDRYLGTDNFNKLHAPGNDAFGDTTLLREQTGYYLVRKLGLPYNYRRFFSMVVNGTRKGNTLMEDTQVAGDDVIEEYFEDEAEGRLFKLQPWFEFDDITVTGGTAAGFQNVSWCLLTKFTSTNNTYKTARYRNNYLSRAVTKTANDYTNVYALVNAASATASPNYWQGFTDLVDTEQWARTFAVEHAVGNWDSFGNRNSQNMYGYKPENGKWKLLIWDYNIILGAGSDGPGANLFQYQTLDANMGYLNTFPAFRRQWWRGYKDLVNGPMMPENVDPTIDAKYAAFRASGLAPLDPVVVKQWIASARQSIASQLAAVDVNSFSITSSNITGNILTLSGVGGIDVASIRFNGVEWPLTWTGLGNWTVRIPFSSNGVQNISVVAYNLRDEQVFASNNVSTTFVGTIESADTNIVFNEIMYEPAAAGGEYVELFNQSATFTFDISGWNINGIGYTFPPGSFIGPRSYLVIAKDRPTFDVSYGGNIPVAGVFDGDLQRDGETLTLQRPIGTNGQFVVVDRVRYEGALPFPTDAFGTGSSLQVIDHQQENARAGNWASRYVPAVYSEPGFTPAMTNDGWRFVSRTFNYGTDGRFLIYLNNAGSVLLDDIALVAGTNAGVGPNFITNGDFESPINVTNSNSTNNWAFGTNMTASVLQSQDARSGAYSLLLMQTEAGNASNLRKDLVQTLVPRPTNTQPVTVSFWYFATNNTATELTVKTVGNALNMITNIGVIVTPSNYIAPQIISEAVVYATPGASNQFFESLPAFQPLWINEVQAENLTGVTDVNGERDGWVEIYNQSTNSVSLDGLYLSASYTNLTHWSFPPGSSIGPTQFMVVFCDAQPTQSTAAEHHTSFTLSPGSGSVALSRLHNGEPQVLDYVNYRNVNADRSFGSFPDGQPFQRSPFFYVTPRAKNDGRSAPLVAFINEWMAQNTNTIADPADGDFDDWFEIYNPGNQPIDLDGYYLTDNLLNKFQYRITTNGPHVIPPGGRLLVWADGEIGQNMDSGVPRQDMHVSFNLRAAGEAIGLFAADGTQIDAVVFGQQTNNIGMGRFPDGSANVVFMPGTATPRLPNYIAGAPNTAPVLSAIGSRALYIGQTVSFQVVAADPDPGQVLTFGLDQAPAGATLSSGGLFNWTPSAIGAYTVAFRVADTGTPSLSDTETITITVLEYPRFTAMRANAGNLELGWATHPGQVYRIEFKDDLAEPNWSFLRDVTATGQNISITNSTAAPSQRFYRITAMQ